VVLVMLTVPLFSRNIFEIGLGLSGIYEGNPNESMDQLMEGMAAGTNWLIGVEGAVRLAVVNITALAMPNDVADNSLTLMSTIGLSLPVINDFLYADIGTGLRTNFEFPNDGESSVNGRYVSQTNFVQTVNSSPIHFRTALNFLFGKASLAIAYYWESQATVQTVQDLGGWAKLFQPGEMANIGISLRISLF